MYTLVNFGENENGFWNMKRFKFETVLDAVSDGELVTTQEDGEGFLVFHTWFDKDKGYDRVEVVYRENADDVDLSIFPYITVKRLINF